MAANGTMYSHQYVEGVRAEAQAQIEKIVANYEERLRRARDEQPSVVQHLAVLAADVAAARQGIQEILAGARTAEALAKKREVELEAECARLRSEVERLTDEITSPARDRRKEDRGRI